VNFLSILFNLIMEGREWEEGGKRRDWAVFSSLSRKQKGKKWGLFSHQAPERGNERGEKERLKDHSPIFRRGRRVIAENVERGDGQQS